MFLDSPAQMCDLLVLHYKQTTFFEEKCLILFYGVESMPTIEPAPLAAHMCTLLDATAFDLYHAMVDTQSAILHHFLAAVMVT
jgi:hypothetical protein